MKGSKDSDYIVVSKKTLSKQWLIELASRARRPQPQMRVNLPAYHITHKRTQTSTLKKINCKSS